MIFRYLGVGVLFAGAVCLISAIALLIFSEMNLPGDVKNPENKIRFLNNASISVIFESPDKRDKRLAVLNDNWRANGQIGDNAFNVVVSQNYVTDFASIPTYFHWFIGPFGAHAEAAIIHDWMYAVGGESEKDRKLADVVFYASLIETGTNQIQARMMYSMVRLFGSNSFGRDDEWARFYDPNLSLFIPEECIIEKPQRGFFSGSSDQEFRAISGVASSFELNKLWIKAFSRSKCRAKLYSIQLEKQFSYYGQPYIWDENLPDDLSNFLKAVYAIEKLVPRPEDADLRCAVIIEAISQIHELDKVIINEELSNIDERDITLNSLFLPDSTEFITGLREYLHTPHLNEAYLKRCLLYSEFGTDL